MDVREEPGRRGYPVRVAVARSKDLPQPPSRAAPESVPIVYRMNSRSGDVVFQAKEATDDRGALGAGFLEPGVRSPVPLLTGASPS